MYIQKKNELPGNFLSVRVAQHPHTHNNYIKFELKYVCVAKIVQFFVVVPLAIRIQKRKIHINPIELHIKSRMCL